MNFKKFMFFSFLTLVFSGFAGEVSHANERLIFNQQIPYSSLEKIKRFEAEDVSFSASLDAPAQNIARSDLNRDGLDEFIVRSAACASGAACSYFILAESEKALVSLGQFNGQNLLLGNDYTHGVRNLLLFGNRTNDFDFTLLKWDPARSSYSEAR